MQLGGLTRKWHLCYHYTLLGHVTELSQQAFLQIQKKANA
jgi:hypothetical protein